MKTIGRAILYVLVSYAFILTALYIESYKEKHRGYKSSEAYWYW